MKRIFLVSALTFLLLMKVNHTFAGRSFSTEDAGIAGKDVTQLELGSEYAEQKNGNKEYFLQFIPIYGITEHLELSAELPFKFSEVKKGNDIRGFEDITFALKALIVKEGKNNPALLFKTIVKYDNGNQDSGLGSGDKDLGFVVAASKEICNFTLHSNIGYTFAGKDYDSSFKNYILYGIAGEYSITEKTNLLVEIYGESNSNFHVGVFKQHNLETLLGLAYQLTEKIVIDSGVKIGLLDNSPDYGLTFGLSMNF